MFEQLLRSLLGPPLLLHETLASPERRHFGAQLTVLPPGLPLDPVSLPELEQLTVAVQTQTAALAAAGAQLAQRCESHPLTELGVAATDDAAAPPATELFRSGVYPVPAQALRECELLLRAVTALHTLLVAGLAAARPCVGDKTDVGASWEPEVSEFAGDEAAALLEVHGRTAASRMIEATTMATETPALLRAVSEGLIPSAGARAVTTEIGSLLETAQRAAAVDIVLAHARTVAAANGLVTPGRLAQWARAAVIELDPEAANRKAREAQAARGVYLRTEADAMARLDVVDRADRALVSWAIVDQLARTAAPRAGADPAIDCERRHHAAAPDASHDCRTLAAKRMDALRFLLTTHPLVTGEHFPLHVLDPGVPAPEGATSSMDSNVDDADVTRLLDAPSPLWRSNRLLLDVTVPVTTLTGQAEAAGVIAGYGPIPPALAAQIAAETTWRRLLTDPATGAVLDVGTTRYKPTAAIAAFVTARDRTCRCGCGQPARSCDLDHTVPFPDGPTSTVNLAPLERHGHRRKQHPAWRLRREGDVYYWTTPGGYTFTVSPEAVGPILTTLARDPDRLALTFDDEPEPPTDDDADA